MIQWYVSTSSMQCNAIYFVINVLVTRSISMSSLCPDSASEDCPSKLPRGAGMTPPPVLPFRSPRLKLKSPAVKQCQTMSNSMQAIISTLHTDQCVAAVVAVVAIHVDHTSKPSTMMGKIQCTVIVFHRNFMCIKIAPTTHSLLRITKLEGSSDLDVAQKVYRHAVKKILRTCKNGHVSAECSVPLSCCLHYTVLHKAKGWKYSQQSDPSFTIHINSSHHPRIPLLSPLDFAPPERSLCSSQ